MRRLRAALLFALLGFGLVAGLAPTGALERLELLTLDARYLLGLGRRPPGDDIVIAWIDQESMDYLDQNGVPFPWPREVYAQYNRHPGHCVSETLSAMRLLRGSRAISTPATKWRAAAPS